MNPNLPYAQQMPMGPPQRRHDGAYMPMPAHMRPHPGYQPYYQPHMGPMMAPYPAQYPPNWYPYQQHNVHQGPVHPSRHYPQYPHPPPVPQYQQNHSSTVVPMHPHVQASPRPMHQHSPMLGQPHPPPLPPPPPPPPAAAAAAATASSKTSTIPVQAPPSPPPSTPSSVNTQNEPESRVSTPQTDAVDQTPAETPVHTLNPFFPPIPWISGPDRTFPPRAPRRKRKIARSALGTEPITYPLEAAAPGPSTKDAASVQHEANVWDEVEEMETAPTPTQTPTPLTSNISSESDSTQPTTPSSAVVAPQNDRTQRTPTQTQAKTTRVVLPVVPILPQSPTATRRPRRDSIISSTSKVSDIAIPGLVASQATAGPPTKSPDPQSEVTDETARPVSPPAPPKSWADLVRNKPVASNPNGAARAVQIPNGLAVPKAESLADVLNDMSTTPSNIVTRVALLKPRGLVNTGNMCYMNSVLQILIFCTPFYSFLENLARRMPRSFKNETPLVEAMIMFMREYPIIDSADTAEHLRMRLKPDDFEKYGDSFIPEYVYQVIRQLPRFRDMRRGHQQDAQEFLGFLLEELHEECALAMRSGSSTNSGRSTPLGSSSIISDVVDNDGGWMEVGHKQKAAVTRSSGAILTESPVSNIFGGKLRSELKVPGNRLSVTLEPYEPLQLDIGSPQITNIVEALKGLTRPESMQGDFESSRGMKTSATKQVFIETLPPVLILHLKRFHYDSSTKRAEKIWKKVGYPLELEIPKEVFPTQTKNRLAAHGGLPRYKLIGVIYHHGKNANGGHYTVDLRRQDGREWIRLDDTTIRRIRREDVAEGGSEEDPKILAAALERHHQQKSSGNMFERIDQQDEEDEPSSDNVWNQVNGHARSKSTMSSVLNGTSTPASGPQTPRDKSSKDNKVAYLLFYQRIST